MKDIKEIYYLPNRNFTKREAAPETNLNILQAFSEACRNDLREWEQRWWRARRDTSIPTLTAVIRPNTFLDLQ